MVERASITELIQYGNDISAAAYYHVFQDRDGVSLNGGNRQVYVLTFAPGQIPEAKRFWSITAYTPQAIELIPNRPFNIMLRVYGPEGSVANGTHVPPAIEISDRAPAN